MSDKEPHIRNHWPVSVLSCFASVVNVGLPIILTRVLAPEQFGIYKLFFLYLLLTPCLSLTSGFITGLYYWSGQGAKGQKALQLTSWLILLHGAILTLILLFFNNYLAALLNLSPLYVKLLALASLGDVAGRFFEEAAISAGKGWRGGIFYAAFEVARSLSLVFSAWYFKSVVAVFYAQIAFVIFKTGTSYIYAYKLKLARLYWNKILACEVYKYALPISVAGVCGIFITYADQFILANFISKAEFGVYSLGCLAIAPLFMYEYSVTRVMLPEIAESLAKKNSMAAAKVHYATIEQLAFILIPASVGLSLFADSIIKLLFREEFYHAIDFLRISPLTYFILIFPNDLVPRSRGQSKWIFWNFVSFSILSLILCYFGTWSFGAMGALVAAIFSRITMRFYGLWYAGHSSDWKINDYIPIKMLIRCCIVCFISALFLISLKPLFNAVSFSGSITLKSEVFWGMVCGPLFVVLYFLGIFLLKIPAQKVNSRMNILMVCQDLCLGGLERLVFTLCCELKKQENVHVSAFAYDGGTADGFVYKFSDNGIDVDLSQKSHGFSIKTVYRLVQKVMREHIDILHSHDLNALIYATCAKICCPRQVKLIHTQHSFVGYDTSLKQRVYYKFFSYFADEVVAVSEDIKVFHQRYVKHTPVKVIENGILLHELPKDLNEKKAIRSELLDSLEDENLREKLLSLKEFHWLVTLARISPEKGQLELIKVWEKLDIALKQQLALIIIGPDDKVNYAKQVKAQAAKMDLAQNIVFTGATLVPQQWLLASDIFISCSSYEGLPLSPMEAMGVGVPLILSDIAGHVVFSERAELFHLSQIELAANAVTKIVNQLKDPQFFNLCCANAQWVNDNFGISKMVDLYLQAYKKVLQ